MTFYTSFYTYLMRLSNDEDEDVRELAYELELDRNFPRGSTNQSTVRAYVLKKHGRAMVKTFDSVWKRYVKVIAR